MIEATTQRFYDNRQRYLGFVTSCNEKWRIAERAVRELARLTPKPPAFCLFDSGIGEGTVLTNLMRAAHQRFPTVPTLVVGKEISLEDVRHCLDKLPDRFVEHPASVVVCTNLKNAEAPSLKPTDPAGDKALNWLIVELGGGSAYEYSEQLRGLERQLVDAWQVRPSPTTGNPLYVRPSVLVIYRQDHEFLLDGLLSQCFDHEIEYDLALASQPWRASTPADIKVRNVLVPLAHSLKDGGRLLVVQSFGSDPGLELIREVWPDEDPFTIDRYALTEALGEALGDDRGRFGFEGLREAQSLFQFQMHTLPGGIESSIGTSTLYAAWNAATYVGQIDNDRVEDAVRSGRYFDATTRILQKHGGLWFNDESFVICRNGP